MIESSRCGCNRYVSERYNERRSNNERFGECRESRRGNSCGCDGTSNGHCCGWRPAPVRPCRPCGCRPNTCGCSNDNSCHDGIGSGCGCRPRPCPPKPCPPRPCPPRPCPPRPCPPRPCPPRPCPPRPCCSCGNMRPEPYYDRMNEYDFYGYDGMDYMPEGYWNEEFEDGYEKAAETVEKAVVEEKTKE